MATITGSSGADSRNDTLGTQGNYYDMLGGADTVIAGSGNDTIFGGDGNDRLFGGAGNDLLYGGAGADSLVGGAGNDTLFGGTNPNNADDTLIGGTGFDYVSYASASGAVTVNLATGRATGADGNDQISQVEGVIGSAFNDVITGDGGANNLRGLAGNDTIDGGGGNDTIEGGLGNDSLVGGAGNDTLSFDNAGAGVTVNMVTGRATGTQTGTDTFSGFEGVLGSDFGDSILGDAGANTINGGLGNDTIDGGDGNDLLIGGPEAGQPSSSTPVNLDFNWNLAGNDAAAIPQGYTQDTGGIEVKVSYTEGFPGSTITVETGVNTPGEITSGTIYRASGETFNPNSSAELYRPGGQAGADTPLTTLQLDFSSVSGSGFQDEVRNVAFRISDIDETEFRDFVTVRAYDAEGNEVPVILTETSATLTTNGNVVSANAGSGNRAPSDAGGSVLVTIAGPVARVVIEYGNLETAQQWINVSDVQFQALPVIDNDSILGGAGNDTILGGSGNDTIDGGADADSIFGGSGNDRILGSGGSDTLYGDDGNDFLDGGTENDLLFGGAGDDTIVGGAGDDTLQGGTGNDSLVGGQGMDFADYSDATGGVFVDLVASRASLGGIGIDTLSGIDGLIGSDFNDTLRGFDGSSTAPGDTYTNVFYGGAGNDLLEGLGGNDSLFGGTGDDTIDGGADDDWLFGDAGNDSILGGLGNDTIDGGAGNDIIAGGAGADSIVGGLGDDSIDGGADNDRIFGNEGNDTLLGGAGDDYIDGGENDDLIFGGIGNDILLGGAGNDTLRSGTGADSLYGGDGNDVFLFAPEDFTGTPTTKIVDGGGVRPSPADDYDVIDLTEFGWSRVDILYTNNDPSTEAGTILIYAADGVTLIGRIDFTEIEKIIPCFTPGTMILTDLGEVAVEALLPGDLVMTRDNGLQPLRWVGQRRLSMLQLMAEPDLQPVRIGRGALAGQGPDRDMLVSPQHRILVEGARAEMLFGEAEVLVPAKHLLDKEGVARVLPTEGVTYIHILFDRHEIVQSDGIWTESFQPADRMLSAMEEPVRGEVLALFPELARSDAAFDSARLSLKAHEARVLLAD